MDNFKTHSASAFYKTFKPKEAKSFGIASTSYSLLTRELVTEKRGLNSIVNQGNQRLNEELH